MRIVRKYIAEDGTEFNTEEECRAYERGSILHKIADYIQLFDHAKKPITECPFQWWKVGYVWIKQPWYNIPEDIVSAWEEIMDNELDELACDRGEGWYFQDDNDVWYYWSDFEEEFHKIESNMKNMMEIYN